jgi:glucokinase
VTSGNWIGVDLGGTKVLAGVFDAEGKLLARQKVPTEAAQGQDAVLGQLRKVVDAVLSEASVRPGQIAALGMGIPGQVDPTANRVRYAPNLGWRNFDLAQELARHWSWPSFFENDVKLGTYGEFVHGAARGARHVLGVFVGTGVGGGLILNGELYNGFNFSAGEIGHTILHWRKGTELETLAGRRSMMRRAEELLADAPKQARKDWKGIDPAEVKSSHLAQLYEKDNPIAAQLVDDAARALGAALGSAINLLSPEVIVLGGGLAGALGEPFQERVWEIALRFALPQAADGVRCVPAALKDDSGIYGAAAYARKKKAAG